jgi:hypothetical protein
VVALTVDITVGGVCSSVPRAVTVPPDELLELLGELELLPIGFLSLLPQALSSAATLTAKAAEANNPPERVHFIAAQGGAPSRAHAREAAVERM